MPGNLLTLPEVAAHFHKGRRWMREFLKDHPYYRLAGRTMLFGETDIAKLWDAMERPRDLTRVRKGRARSAFFFNRSADEALKEALRLARSHRPRNRKGAL
jgi:hypothetical protein